MVERKNRRGAIRVDLHLKVEVLAQGRRLSGLITGNLSMSGVLLRTCEELPRNTPCRLRIPTGEAGAEVQAEALVVRVYPGAMAFQFTRFPAPVDQDRLRSLVVRHAPEPETA